jgi:hypothetical protein
MLGMHFSAYGMQCAKLVTSTNSGKTLKLSIGALHGIRDGDRVQLSIEAGTLDFPKYLPISTAELVKIFPNYSYWYAPKVTKFAKYLKTGRKICMLLESNSLRGRINPKFSYKAIGHEEDYVEGDIPETIIQQGDVEPYFVYDNKKNGPKVDKKYVSKGPLGKSKSAVPLENSDYDEIKYLKSHHTLFDKNKLGQAINREIIDEQHLQQLKKVNKLKYGYDELYYNVAQSNDRSKLKVSTPRVVDEYREKKFEEAEISENTKIMVAKEGKLWSADMDKHELKEYIVKSGIALEKQRRANLLALKSGNEVSFFMTSNMTSNYTTEDPNHQNNGLSLGLIYDFHLVRTSRDFKAWSIDIMAEQGLYSVDLGGGINGRFSYGSFATHLNYYFWNFPHTLNKFAWFAGVGVKRGNGTISSVNLSKEYDYQVLSMPHMHLGVKYRIPAARKYELNSNLGFGFGVRMEYESLRISSLSSVDENIEANRNITNTRINFTLSVYF